MVPPLVELLPRTISPGGRQIKHQTMEPALRLGAATGSNEPDRAHRGRAATDYRNRTSPLRSSGPSGYIVKGIVGAAALDQVLGLRCFGS